MRLQGRALPEGKRALGWLTGWAGPGTFSTELGCRENVCSPAVSGICQTISIQNSLSLLHQASSLGYFVTAAESRLRQLTMKT